MRGVVLLLVVAGLGAGLAPPRLAAAGEEVERGLALVRRGLEDPQCFARARDTFRRVLDGGSSSADKHLATYGLAQLRRHEALVLTTDPKTPYEEVRSAFKEAATELDTFGSASPTRPRAIDAQLAGATTRLVFAGWAADLLADEAALKARGATAPLVRGHVRVSTEAARLRLEKIRDRAQGPDAEAVRSLAALSGAVARYTRTFAEKPKTKPHAKSLAEAAHALEGFVMEHDGALPAAHAMLYLAHLAWHRAQSGVTEREQERRSREVVDWVYGLVEGRADDPAWQRLIAVGLVHLTRSCLRARRIAGTNFYRLGSQVMEAAERQHPWIWTRPDGLRAVLGWARIEHARDRTTHAVELVRRAADAAREIGDAAVQGEAEAELDALARHVNAAEGAGDDPDLLLRSARAALRDGKRRQAIAYGRRIIRAAPASRAAFLRYGWPVWRLMADAYASLGDPLKEALALESIHDAWMGGLIPRDGEQGKRNLQAAGDARRASQAALRLAAERTGSALVRARAETIGRAFTREYAGHPARDASAYVPAQKRRPTAPPPPAPVPRFPAAFELSLAQASAPADVPPRPASARLQAALRWLAAHQSPNGRWEAEGFGTWCDGEEVTDPARLPTGTGEEVYDVGVTGLALCAFLGAGFTHRGRHAFNRVVARGLRFLMQVQDPEGGFGPRSTQRYSFNHATAALAVMQAHRKTGSTVLAGSAQRALDFIALARNPYFAWRYGIKPGDNDTAVSAFMMLPLRSAQLMNKGFVKRGRPARMTIDESAFDGLKAWLDKITDPDYGKAGYVQRGFGVARYEGAHENWPADTSEGPTAMGMTARLFMGEDPRKSKLLKLGAALCTDLPPNWKPGGATIDLIYWYFATIALHQIGGDSWSAWNKALEAAAQKGLHAAGDVCRHKGSCDPIGRWGMVGGRVYSTALMAMIVEILEGHETAFGFGR